jgi:hypothetical protein
MFWVSPFFHVEAKFGPLEEIIKTINLIRDECFHKSRRYSLLEDKKNKGILEKLKAEPEDTNQIGYDI